MRILSRTLLPLCATAFVTAQMVVVVGSASAAKLPPAGLPDHRAYELVSPPVKHGADVAGDSQRTRAASDGSAATFTSLGGFSDVRGTGQATEYLSQRASGPSPGDNGWSTHAITPQQAPLTLFGAFQGLDSEWEREFSPDLSSGVFRAWSPLTDQDPNVVNVENLYQRTDLRAPGAGTYRLITPCPACGSPIAPLNVLLYPRLAGTSADFSHVLFESSINLTADAPAQPGLCSVSPFGCRRRLYEWADGTLRLAGILPDPSCGSPPCAASSSVAGVGTSSGLTPRVISADGSRIIFTDTSTGDLYERIDASDSVQINASEKVPADPALPATYQTASADGKRIFFLSAEQLTADDNNGAVDLYAWDADGAPNDHLTRLSVDNNLADGVGGVAGVMGASGDGQYIYFIAQGQLLAGKPIPSTVGIYASHNGTITYVGAMEGAGDVIDNIVGVSSLGGGIRARVTPDGKHLAFRSHSGIGLLSAHGGVDYDQAQPTCNNGCTEYYVYSAATNSLACASCVPGGAAPTTGVDTWVRSGGTLTTALHLNHPLTDDGRWLFFHTSESLVTGDANGKSDVYVYDVQNGTVRLVSTGSDPADSYFLDASNDGKDVFFLTHQQLVGWDTDANYDLYDARVDGGFPDPPSPAPLCSEDACQGPRNGAPSAVEGGSSTFKGTGDVKASAGPTAEKKAKPNPKRCRRGFVRKRVNGKARCVKRSASRSRKATASRGRAR